MAGRGCASATSPTTSRWRRWRSASQERLGGPIDTLVNNAGVYRPRPFLDYTLDDWTWMLDVNVVAIVRVTQAFLPGLLALERSRIINVSSIAGKKGTFGQSAYNASKHAQIGITRCLAMETGTTGLRVNAVCPGFTKTDLIDLDELGRAHGRPGAEVWAGVEQAALDPAHGHPRRDRGRRRLPGQPRGRRRQRAVAGGRRRDRDELMRADEPRDGAAVPPRAACR